MVSEPFKPLACQDPLYSASPCFLHKPCCLRKLCNGQRPSTSFLGVLAALWRAPHASCGLPTVARHSSFNHEGPTAAPAFVCPTQHMVLILLTEPTSSEPPALVLSATHSILTSLQALPCYSLMEQTLPTGVVACSSCEDADADHHGAASIIEAFLAYLADAVVQSTHAPAENAEIPAHHTAANRVADEDDPAKTSIKADVACTNPDVIKVAAVATGPTIGDDEAALHPSSVRETAIKTTANGRATQPADGPAQPADADTQPADSPTQPADADTQPAAKFAAADAENDGSDTIIEAYFGNLAAVPPAMVHTTQVLDLSGATQPACHDSTVHELPATPTFQGCPNSKPTVAMADQTRPCMGQTLPVASSCHPCSGVLAKYLLAGTVARFCPTSDTDGVDTIITGNVAVETPLSACSHQARHDPDISDHVLGIKALRATFQGCPFADIQPLMADNADDDGIIQAFLGNVDLAVDNHAPVQSIQVQPLAASAAPHASTMLLLDEALSEDKVLISSTIFQAFLASPNASCRPLIGKSTQLAADVPLHSVTALEAAAICHTPPAAVHLSNDPRVHHAKVPSSSMKINQHFCVAAPLSASCTRCTLCCSSKRPWHFSALSPHTRNEEEDAARVNHALAKPMTGAQCYEAIPMCRLCCQHPHRRSPISCRSLTVQLGEKVDPHHKNATVHPSPRIYPAAADGATINDAKMASILGRAHFMLTRTRPDIHFAVNQLSRFLHNLGVSQPQILKRFLSHLQQSQTPELSPDDASPLPLPVPLLSFIQPLPIDPPSQTIIQVPYYDLNPPPSPRAHSPHRPFDPGGIADTTLVAHSKEKHLSSTSTNSTREGSMLSFRLRGRMCSVQAHENNTTKLVVMYVQAKAKKTHGIDNHFLFCHGYDIDPG